METVKIVKNSSCGELSMYWMYAIDAIQCVSNATEYVAIEPTGEGEEVEEFTIWSVSIEDFAQLLDLFSCWVFYIIGEMMDDLLSDLFGYFGVMVSGAFVVIVIIGNNDERREEMVEIVRDVATASVSINENGYSMSSRAHADELTNNRRYWFPPLGVVLHSLKW